MSIVLNHKNKLLELRSTIFIIYICLISNAVATLNKSPCCFRKIINRNKCRGSFPPLQKKSNNYFSKIQTSLQVVPENEILSW